MPKGATEAQRIWPGCIGSSLRFQDEEGDQAMKVQCKMFSSSTRPWERLIEEATEFASNVGRDRLINISVSAAGGSDLFGVGGQGAIFVWYWE
jgi:hypothetical protein